LLLSSFKGLTKKKKIKIKIKIEYKNKNKIIKNKYINKKNNNKNILF